MARNSAAETAQLVSDRIQALPKLLPPVPQDADLPPELQWLRGFQLLDHHLISTILFSTGYNGVLRSAMEVLLPYPFEMRRNARESQVIKDYKEQFDKTNAPPKLHDALKPKLEKKKDEARQGAATLSLLTVVIQMVIDRGHLTYDDLRESANVDFDITTEKEAWLGLAIGLACRYSEAKRVQTYMLPVIASASPQDLLNYKQREVQVYSFDSSNADSDITSEFQSARKEAKVSDDEMASIDVYISQVLMHRNELKKMVGKPAPSNETEEEAAIRVARLDAYNDEDLTTKVDKVVSLVWWKLAEQARAPQDRVQMARRLYEAVRARNGLKAAEDAKSGRGLPFDSAEIKVIVNIIKKRIEASSEDPHFNVRQNVYFDMAVEIKNLGVRARTIEQIIAFCKKHIARLMLFLARRNLPIHLYWTEAQLEQADFARRKDDTDLWTHPAMDGEPENQDPLEKDEPAAIVADDPLYDDAERAADGLVAQDYDALFGDYDEAAQPDSSINKPIIFADVDFLDTASQHNSTASAKKTVGTTPDARRSSNPSKKQPKATKNPSKKQPKAMNPSNNMEEVSFCSGGATQDFVNSDDFVNSSSFTKSDTSISGFELGGDGFIHVESDKESDEDTQPRLKRLRRGSKSHTASSDASSKSNDAKSHTASHEQTSGATSSARSLTGPASLRDKFAQLRGARERKKGGGAA
ncbi:hypothetical protein JCM10908_001267 [Rhodotorula pacifica]|uniref:uncharacterized protein n=1 Tax=Rhodotorula pacifica TaxID=1495444 RepID=UPI00317EEC3B